MPNRLRISRDAAPIPCEACGRATLYVARLVSEDGTQLGQTLVCTSCRRHRAEATATPTR
ncbi:hypothetical protein VA596_15880 [Amycolatopsis sp., V23-08]|uniref:Small CPxCG-related zinc finger protein n=1 Tax=Amycolatopsis heterodermiae TaxID=3110235 RepID=A0ABU5R5W0_9PSEU|nr:hypothetical protein [Amycolatopsis sp., V23-08]MEA5361024.1 hypothetical protein [Amycolatopsis sp., V23-08]